MNIQTEQVILHQKLCIRQADDFKDRMDAIVDSFSMCKSISDVNNVYNSMYDLSRQIRRFNW